MRRPASIETCFLRSDRLLAGSVTKSSRCGFRPSSSKVNSTYLPASSARGARVAVVHAEGGEVAHHDEARLAVSREALRVGEGLLEGRDHAALAFLGFV